MPIVRIDQKLIYYCHVPRTAGTALEGYLAEQFGPLAFADQDFLATPEHRPWSRSSPQHIDAFSVERLFPEGFFDAVFAVVRHPVERIVSAFKFQKLIEGKIPSDINFNDWIRDLNKKNIEQRWKFDNHFLAMNALIPKNSSIFRLEDGLGAVVDYLQSIVGSKYSLPNVIRPANVTGNRLRALGAVNEPIGIEEDNIEHIFDLYRDDFERYGYSLANNNPKSYNIIKSNRGNLEKNLTESSRYPKAASSFHEKDGKAHDRTLPDRNNGETGLRQKRERERRCSDDMRERVRIHLGMARSRT